MTAFPHAIKTSWKLLAIMRRDTPSLTNGDCARSLGVNENTIRHWLQTPLYQSYENWFLEKSYEATPLAIKMSRAEVKESIDEFAEEMLFRLKDIVETSSDEKLIANIGFDMLDRAGYSEPKKDSNRPINLVLTPELATMLFQRSREIASESVVVGEVVGHPQ